MCWTQYFLNYLPGVSGAWPSIVWHTVSKAMHSLQVSMVPFKISVQNSVQDLFSPVILPNVFHPFSHSLHSFDYLIGTGNFAWLSISLICLIISILCFFVKKKHTNYLKYKFTIYMVRKKVLKKTHTSKIRNI